MSDPSPNRGAAPSRNLMSFLALSQGAFYLLTGIWPLLSPRTFQAITGPKYDFWLVKTVGVLIGVIGGVLTLAGARGTSQPEVPVLAAGSAAGLTAIDVVYVAKRRIRPVYLLDAVAEVALIVGWVVAWLTRPTKSKKLAS